MPFVLREEQPTNQPKFVLREPEKPEASWGEIEKTVAKNVPINLAAGASGAVALGISTTENAPSSLFPAVELLKILKEPVQYAAKYWYDKAEKNIEGLNLKPGSAKSYATMIQESAGQQLPLIAGGILTGGTGYILPAMGVLTAGQKKAEFLSKGFEGGDLNAITQGIIESVTEKIPLGKWLKPGEAFMKRILKATAFEIPGEITAQVTQSSLDKIALNPEMSWGEYFQSMPSQIKDTVIVTIGQSLLMGVPMHAGSKYLEHRQKVKDQLVNQFQINESEAENAINTIEQNNATQQEEPPVLQDIFENPEQEIQKIKNAAIISDALKIDPETAYELHDDIIKELENKIANESPVIIGDKESVAEYQDTNRMYGYKENNPESYINTDSLYGYPQGGREIKARWTPSDRIKPEDIVMNEKKLLKFKLQAEAKGAREGFREGKKVSRAETILKFKEKELSVKDARDSVANYIREAVAPKHRGKFINAVKNTRTQKDVAKVFSRVDRFVTQQELKEGISTLKKTAEKLSESKMVSVDYRNKIKDIIGQYELTGHGEKLINRLNETQEYIDRQKQSGEDVSLPQRVLNKLKILSRVPKEDLTMNQAEGLIGEIELLGKLGKTKWKSKVALYEGEKQERKNSLLDTASPINSMKSKMRTIGENPKGWSEAYIKLRNYLQKTRTGLTPIDGLADITGMHEMKSVLDIDFGNYLSFNDERIIKWHELTKDFDTGNFEKIGAVAAMNQEGGLERLVNSGRTEEELSAVKLTEQEQKAYEFVRETFDELYPDVKKYAADIYNVDVGQVKNYVSFMSDFDAMSELEIYERFGQKAEEIANTRTKTVEQGFTKERSNLSPLKLELNIDKIFQRHIDDVAYMLTMGRDIKMYSEIVNSIEMKEKLGDMGSLAWLEWLNLMARKGGVSGANRKNLLDVIRRNVGAGVLAFRLSSVAIQVTSLSDACATIGAEWTMKGVNSVCTDRAWRDFVMNNFPEIRKAIGDDIAFREFGNGLWGNLAKKGMKPLQYMDVMMRVFTAAGTYQKLADSAGIEIDLENPDLDLIAEATRLMRHSQGSSFFKDQPLAIETGFGVWNNRTLNKTMLQFQSFLLNRWNNIIRQVWHLGFKQGDYKKGATSLFWLVLVSSALETGIRRGVRELITLFSADDDAKEKDFASDMALNVVQNVPIAGQLASSLTYASNPVPTISAFEDVLSGTSQAIKAKKGKTKVKGAIRAAGGAGSLAGVAGASQAAQIARKSVD